MAGLRSTRKAVPLGDVDVDVDEEDYRLPLEDLLKFLTRSVDQKGAIHGTKATPDDPYPKTITFPYSRHSSYAELRDLVQAFKPLDVYPCTVDRLTWHEGKVAS